MTIFKINKIGLLVTSIFGIFFSSENTEKIILR